ncbi:MAG: hypothetical protein WCV67_05355 [Victivallaceae bacterium]|jgi:hypothetical protein
MKDRIKHQQANMKKRWKIICVAVIIGGLANYIYSSIQAKNKYDKRLEEIGSFNWKLNENNDLNKVMNSVVKNYSLKNGFIPALFDILVTLGYTKDLDGYIKAIYLDKIKPYSFLNNWMNNKETIRMILRQQWITAYGNDNVIDIVKEDNKIKIARFHLSKKVEKIMVQNPDGTITEYTIIKHSPNITSAAQNL